MLRYRDLSTSTTDVLDLTSVTIDAFTALVPPFEAAFLDDMADWTLDGRQRQARRYTTDKHCPRPTPEDRLLFILVYLKQNPTPLLHGCLFGMRQAKATPWIHVLLPVWRNTLRTIGEAPSRRVEAWHAGLGVEVPSLPLDPSPAEAGQSTPPPVAPLCVMTAPSDLSRAPTTRLNRNRVIAARTSGTC
jgi:hypothetical protein